MESDWSNGMVSFNAVWVPEQTTVNYTTFSYNPTAATTFEQTMSVSGSITISGSLYGQGFWNRSVSVSTNDQIYIYTSLQSNNPISTYAINITATRNGSYVIGPSDYTTIPDGPVIGPSYGNIIYPSGVTTTPGYWLQ